jgi:hypothetical protein
MPAPVAHCTSPPQTTCFFAGLTVADFSNVPESEPIFIADGAAVTLVRCTFSRNSKSNGAALIGAYERISTTTPQQPTIVFLQQCTFHINPADYAVVKDPGTHSPSEEFAVIYSDDPALNVLEVTSSNLTLAKTSPEPLSAVPAGRIRINCSSPWLLMVQQVRPSSAPSPPTLTIASNSFSILCARLKILPVMNVMLCEASDNLPPPQDIRREYGRKQI